MSVIYMLLALATAAVAAWQMYTYVISVNTRAYGANGNMTALIISIVCIIVAVIFAGLFLSGRVNKEEELHITK